MQALVFALVLFAAPSPEARPRVVLVHPGVAAGLDETWPEAESRAATELGAAGFIVEHYRGAATTPSERRLELVAAVESCAALAAVRIRRGTDAITVEVWVTDAGIGKLRERRLDRRVDGLEVGTAVVALRLVELLQAARLEIGLAPLTTPTSTATPDAPPPTPETLVGATGTPPPGDLAHEPLPQGPRGWQLALGVASTYAGPELTPAFGMSLGAAWRGESRWRLGGTVRADVAGGKASLGGASTSIDFFSLYGELGYAVGCIARVCVPVGVTGGWTRLRARGTAPAPMLTHIRTADRAALGGFARGEIVLTTRLWLAANLEALWLVPQTPVFLGERRVATLGGSLGLEIRVGLQL